MYAPLYLAVAALAVVLLLVTVYLDRAEVFSSAFGGLCFALLALQSELTTASGGEVLTVTVGEPLRYLLLALAALSWLLTAASALGYYSTETRDPDAPQDIETNVK